MVTSRSVESHTAHAHDHPGPHEMPTEGAALTGLAVSATLHCLTGCAIGEVAGVAIGTAAGWSDLATIALAIALAFLFGYALTSLPLLRAGLALSAVIPIALASDTLSIATMEVVDNAILLAHPGRDGGRPRRRAVLGLALVRPVHRLHPHRARQPLAARPWQGPLRRPRDRHPRRARRRAWWAPRWSSWPCSGSRSWSPRRSVSRAPRRTYTRRSASARYAASFPDFSLRTT